MAFEGTARRTKRTRRLAFVAAGLLAVSALGYHVVAQAPSSTAADSADSFDCTGGEAKVVIKKKGNGFVGTAELTGDFIEYGDELSNCVGIGANGTSGLIKSTADDANKTCVLEAKIDNANGQDTDSTETSQSGMIKMVVPQAGGAGKVTIKDTTKSGEKVTATATLKGIELTDCKLVEDDTITATDVDATVVEP
ncbi:hypothetical protein ABZ942_37080 [Nocardia sp. NPDC046473]|uniref:hypothetical protein n=1 Tax=Nocardia sp. NPDC046473 TaxID=3155733 RepID=UPI0033D342FC